MPGNQKARPENNFNPAIMPLSARPKIVFFANSPFALPILQKLVGADHPPFRLYTNAPKPAGRGQKLRQSAIYQFGKENAIPIISPTSLNDSEAEKLRQIKPDLALVVAYGKIFPKQFLAIPVEGCINFHASLLPRWRGGAPIQRAIMAGDRQSGVSVIYMVEKLDQGPILMQRKISLPPTMDAGALHDALSALSAEMVLPLLDGLRQNRLTACPQNGAEANTAPKLQPEEMRINWDQPADQVGCQIRAGAPSPGAWFMLGQQRIKILTCEVIAQTGQPGQIITAARDGFHIACRSGAIKLLYVQQAGRKPMRAADFLRGLKNDGVSCIAL